PSATPSTSLLSLHDALLIYLGGTRGRGGHPVGPRPGDHRGDRPHQAGAGMSGISIQGAGAACPAPTGAATAGGAGQAAPAPWMRSEEHTSELQSRFDLVCRL